MEALESCCALGVHGLVLLIEEPELYLRPQLQRYLYRLLRRFASGGNQVIYSTHSPAFLNVARLDELVFVERLPEVGTRAVQPPCRWRPRKERSLGSSSAGVGADRTPGRGGLSGRS